MVACEQTGDRWTEPRRVIQRQQRKRNELFNPWFALLSCLIGLRSARLPGRDTVFGKAQNGRSSSEISAARAAVGSDHLLLRQLVSACVDQGLSKFRTDRKGAGASYVQELCGNADINLEDP